MYSHLWHFIESRNPKPKGYHVYEKYPLHMGPGFEIRKKKWLEKGVNPKELEMNRGLKSHTKK